MKLNKNEKRALNKWIKALRSGEYKQTRGFLEKNGGFCCAGVACKVFIPKEKQLVNEKGELVGGWVDDDWKETRIVNKIANDMDDRYLTHIVDMNDHLKLTFDEIADILEGVYVNENIK